MELLHLCPRIQVIHQPRLNQLPLKPPLIAHFEGWEPLLGHQAVDGKLVYF